MPSAELPSDSSHSKCVPDSLQEQIASVKKIIKRLKTFIKISLLPDIPDLDAEGMAAAKKILSELDHSLTPLAAETADVRRRVARRQEELREKAEKILRLSYKEARMTQRRETIELRNIESFTKHPEWIEIQDKLSAMPAELEKAQKALEEAQAVLPQAIESDEEQLKSLSRNVCEIIERARGELSRVIARSRQSLAAKEPNHIQNESCTLLSRDTENASGRSSISESANPEIPVTEKEVREWGGYFLEGVNTPEEKLARMMDIFLYDAYAIRDLEKRLWKITNKTRDAKTVAYNMRKVIACWLQEARIKIQNSDSIDARACIAAQAFAYTNVREAVVHAEEKQRLLCSSNILRQHVCSNEDPESYEKLINDLVPAPVSDMTVSCLPDTPESAAEAAQFFDAMADEEATIASLRISAAAFAQIVKKKSSLFNADVARAVDVFIDTVRCEVAHDVQLYLERNSSAIGGRVFNFCVAYAKLLPKRREQPGSNLLSKAINVFRLQYLKELVTDLIARRTAHPRQLFVSHYDSGSSRRT